MLSVKPLLARAMLKYGAALSNIAFEKEKFIIILGMLFIRFLNIVGERNVCMYRRGSQLVRFKRPGIHILKNIYNIYIGQTTWIVKPI